MASQHQPVRVEILVDGKSVGAPFVAEELAVTESRGELRVLARRSLTSAYNSDNPLPGVPTGTLLDGYFGD